MKAIAIIDVPDGGKGKWYIDGEIRYTEDESLMKKFDADMIPLKPMPKKRNYSEELADTRGFDMYMEGWNDCLKEITDESNPNN